MYIGESIVYKSLDEAFLYKMDIFWAAMSANVKVLCAITACILALNIPILELKIKTFLIMFHNNIENSVRHKIDQ